MGRLLHFGTRCLRAPPQGVQRWSLATSINRQLTDPSPINVNQRLWHPSHNPLSHLATRVSAKICFFPSGSAGRPDGLRPQHLKDMNDNRPLGSGVDPLVSFGIFHQDGAHG